MAAWNRDLNELFTTSRSLTPELPEGDAEDGDGTETCGWGTGTGTVTLVGVGSGLIVSAAGGFAVGLGDAALNL